MVLEESSDETDQDRCSAIVEADNPLRWITEVGDDEAHSGEKFSLVPLYLGHLPPGPVPTLGLVSKVVVAHKGPSGWPSHRMLHQVLYLLPQHLIGRKPDGIAYALSFQVLVHLWPGKGSIRLKQEPHPLLLVAFHH